MDAKAIEEYAVDAVRDCLNYSDHLSSFIAEDDKEPSWDGHIYIYGNKKNKEHLEGRLPVQVKGTVQTIIANETIQYRMETTDLRNYLRDGGILLFVVYIEQDKKAMKTSTQIYYRELTPIRLKEILGSIDSSQKTMLVSLKKMPDKVAEIDNMILNCYSNCKRQTSFADTTLPSYEELNNAGLVEGVSIPFTCFDANMRPEDIFLKNDAYLYVKVRGLEALQPLGGMTDEKFISHEKKVPISVNGILYYNNCNVFETIDRIVYRIGKGLTLTHLKGSNGLSINYSSPKMLRDYVRDQRFMIAAVNNGSMQIGSIQINLNNSDLSQFEISRQTERYEFYNKVARLFEIIGCEEDLDITKLTHTDFRNLSIMITGIVDNKVVEGLRNDLQPLMYVDIGSLRFLIGFDKTEKEGSYILKDFEETNVYAKFRETDDDPKIRFPKYLLLKRDDLLSLSNIPFDHILTSLQSLPSHNHVYNAANTLLLELIAAIDKAEGRRRERLFITALEIADWLCTIPDTAWEPCIAKLNRIQLIKRDRALNDSERNDLYDIIEGNPDHPRILVAAYLLLGERTRAQHFYMQMAQEEQNEFTSYPIYHFWQ